MTGKSDNGWRWLMGVWRTVVAGLLVAGIVGSVVGGRQLEAVASIVNEMNKRLDRMDQRIIFLERRGWGP